MLVLFTKRAIEDCDDLRMVKDAEIKPVIQSVREPPGGRKMGDNLYLYNLGGAGLVRHQDERPYDSPPPPGFWRRVCGYTNHEIIELIRLRDIHHTEMTVFRILDKLPEIIRHMSHPDWLARYDEFVHMVSLARLEEIERERHIAADEIGIIDEMKSVFKYKGMV